MPDSGPKMDPGKKRRLKASGWKVGDAAEFLQLTPEEARYLELKHALGDAVRAERLRHDITQTELAGLLGSSQSRVAKMEAGDPSVSADLLLKALLKLGISSTQLARIIG